MTLTKFSLLDVCIKFLTVCIKVCIISISEHARKGLVMSKKRVNISIDKERLNDLDFFANVRGVNRSKAIEELILIWNHDQDESEQYKRKLNLICISMDAILEEIENADSYEEKDEKKRDAFYELVGCIKAVTG